jgi:transcriptional regulatory protein LevR
MAFRPTVAAADEMQCPGEGMTTVQSLAQCVQHASDMGLIDNAGVTTSLLSEIAAAQAALDNVRPAAAIQILQAFINEVQAQSGVHIEAAHAQHMIMHAQMVIDALN